MSEVRTCDQCGRPTGDKVRFGLCAGCLFECFSTRTGVFLPDRSDPDAEALREDFRVGGGRFRLSSKLGEGGMGQIWLAEDSRLDGKRVALKFVRDAWNGAPELLRDLRLELARTRDLQHPHIVKVHDWHDPGDEPPFVSMEYVDGSSLAVLLKESPEGLDYRRLHPLLVQVSEALQYAHERHGILHRDIKPGNILVDRSGVRESAKLSDFGVGLHLGQKAAPHEIPRGTRPYMSPNHAIADAPSVADDIFSWGVTLFHLLTGKLPYGPTGPGANPPEMRLQEDFGGSSGLKSVPQPVRAMLRRCIDLEASRRPERMSDIARILRANPPLEPSRSVESPYVFRSGDIEDVPSLATRLERCERPVDVWVVQRLSAKTQVELSQFLRGAGEPRTLKESLALDLARLVGGDSVFEEERFGGIELRPATRKLLAGEPQGEPLQRLNRLLLEDAYPDELSRIPEAAALTYGWARLAAVATLLIAMVWLSDRFGREVVAWLRHTVFGPPARLAFRREHIRDPGQLLNAIDARSRPIDEWLGGQLPPRTLVILRTPTEELTNRGAATDSRLLLARDLNRLLGPFSIYDRERFAGIELRPATSNRLSASKDLEEVYELNKLLLQDAYPGVLLPPKVHVDDPKTGLSLSIRSSPGKAEVSLSHLETSFGVTTNVELKTELSRLELENLRPGAYKLLIVQEGFHYPEERFTLDAGRTLHREVFPEQFDATLQVVVQGLENARYVLREVGRAGGPRNGTLEGFSKTFRLLAGIYELGLGDASEILHFQTFRLAPNEHQIKTHRFSTVKASFSASTYDGHPVVATVSWHHRGKPSRGQTPTPPIELFAGERLVTLIAPGYPRTTEQVRLDPDTRTTNVVFVLKPLSQPTPGELYENGLRMRFAPLPTQPESRGASWIGCTEVTIEQFAAFADDVRESFDGMKCLTSTGMVHFANRSFRDPGYPVTPMHPATGISWIDATRFCEWLTTRQRDSGSLPLSLRYAVMTTRDWARAASLPRQRSGRGNFAGLELEAQPDWPRAWTEPGMLFEKDEFPFAAPVGHPDASRDPFSVVNLFDNVQEWCEDPYPAEPHPGQSEAWPGYERTLGSWRYSAQEPYRAVCGGSWYDHDPLFWRLSPPHAALETERTSCRGFRVVIVDPADRRSP